MVRDATEATSIGGCVIVAVTDALQPSESVTFRMYVPATSPPAFTLVPPYGCQLAVKGDDPAVTFTEAAPSFMPKHETSVVDVSESDGPGMLVRVTEVIVVQCSESITCSVYVPGAALVIPAAVLPPGDHEYVYGGVPPETIDVAEPLISPQEGSTTEDVAASSAGAVMLADVIAWQPFTSLTST